MTLAMLFALCAASTELTADLPWKFDVEHRSDVTTYKSTEPIRADARGKTYLRFSVATTTHTDTRAASAAFDATKQGADPDRGLSYGWDLVWLDGPRIVHLQAPCTFAKDNLQKIAARVEATIGEKRPRKLACACGSGCRE